MLQVAHFTDNPKSTHWCPFSYPVVGLEDEDDLDGTGLVDSDCLHGCFVGLFFGCLPLYWHLGIESPQVGHFFMGGWAEMPIVNTAKSRKNNNFFIMSYSLIDDF